MAVHYIDPPLKEPISKPADEAPWCAIGRTRMTDGKGSWYLGTGALFGDQAGAPAAAHVLNGKTAGTITSRTRLTMYRAIAKRAIQDRWRSDTEGILKCSGMGCWSGGAQCRLQKPGPDSVRSGGPGTDRASALNELKKGKSGSNVWLGGYPAQKLSLQPSSIPTSTSGRCTARPVSPTGQDVEESADLRV